MLCAFSEEEVIGQFTGTHFGGAMEVETRLLRVSIKRIKPEVRKLPPQIKAHN